MPVEAWDRESTVKRIESPPPPVSGRGRAIKSLLRQTTMRLTSPFLAREQGIDEHLLRGIDYSLEHDREQSVEALRRLHELEQRVGQLERDAKPDDGR